MAIKFARASLLTVLEAIRGAGGLADGQHIHLFMNDFTPNINTVLGDLTEANFTGYAAANSANYGAAAINAAGQPVMHTGALNFTAADPLTVTAVVYGWYATNIDNDTLLYAERFAAPVPVVYPGQQVTVVLNMRGDSLVS